MHVINLDVLVHPRIPDQQHTFYTILSLHFVKTTRCVLLATLRFFTHMMKLSNVIGSYLALESPKAEEIVRITSMMKRMSVARVSAHQNKQPTRRFNAANRELIRLVTTLVSYISPSISTAILQDAHTFNKDGSKTYIKLSIWSNVGKLHGNAVLTATDVRKRSHIC